MDIQGLVVYLVIQERLDQPQALGQLFYRQHPSITNPTVTNYVETLYSANTSTAITVALTNGTVQQLTLTANATITMPTAVAGKSFIIYVETRCYRIKDSHLVNSSIGVVVLLKQLHQQHQNKTSILSLAMGQIGMVQQLGRTFNVQRI